MSSGEFNHNLLVCVCLSDQTSIAVTFRYCIFTSHMCFVCSTPELCVCVCCDISERETRGWPSHLCSPSSVSVLPLNTGDGSATPEQFSLSLLSWLALALSLSLSPSLSRTHSVFFLGLSSAVNVLGSWIVLRTQSGIEQMVTVFSFPDLH